MIQRKQTIWLLLSSLSCLLAFFIPYGIHSETSISSTLISETDLNAKTDMILMVITIVCIVISFFSIFLYGNRKLQMRFSLLAIVISCAMIGFELYHANQTILSNKLVVGLLGSKIYLGLLIPIISIFFLMLAFNGIRKDEKLIKDSDRLR